jgi:hypothetical protein
MRLARSIPKLGRLPDLQTFECRACGVVVTEAVEAEVLETAPPCESYVLQMDGEVKSRHRRFVNALRAGLQLKQMFPHSDVKVRDAAAVRIP